MDIHAIDAVRYSRGGLGESTVNSLDRLSPEELRQSFREANKKIKEDYSVCVWSENKPR